MFKKLTYNPNSLFPQNEFDATFKTFDKTFENMDQVFKEMDRRMRDVEFGTISPPVTSITRDGYTTVSYSSPISDTKPKLKYKYQTKESDDPWVKKHALSRSSIEAIKTQCVESLEHDDSWVAFKLYVKAIMDREDRMLNVLTKEDPVVKEATRNKFSIWKFIKGLLNLVKLPKIKIKEEKKNEN